MHRTEESENDALAGQYEVPKESAHETGAGLAEYALLVVLIAVIALAALRTVGQEVSIKFSDSAMRIKNASNVQ